jgi:activator of HSP90 ATPase
MVWQAFVDPKVIAAWGGGPAKMSEREEDAFGLWGGEIWGRNREVIKQQKLVQEWHDDKNEDGMLVTFTFETHQNRTHITLLHENVPDKKYKALEKGWDTYYLGPLKKLLESSSE